MFKKQKDILISQYLPLSHMFPVNKPSYFGAPQWVISWAKATGSKFPNQNVVYNTVENMISKSHSTNANTTLCCCCCILPGIHSSARISPAQKQAWYTKVDLLIYQALQPWSNVHWFTKRLQFKDHLKSPSLVKHGTIIDSNLAMSTRSTLQTQTNRCQHLSNRGLFIFGKFKWVLISEIPLCTWVSDSICYHVFKSVAKYGPKTNDLFPWYQDLTGSPASSPHSVTAIFFFPGAHAVPRFVNFGAKWLAKPWSKGFTCFQE